MICSGLKSICADLARVGADTLAAPTRAGVSGSAFATLAIGRCVAGRDAERGIVASSQVFALPNPSDSPLHITGPESPERPNTLDPNAFPAAQRAGPSWQATLPPSRDGRTGERSEPQYSTVSSIWPEVHAGSGPCSRRYTNQMGGYAASATRRHECLARPSRRCGLDCLCRPAGAPPDQPGDSDQATLRDAAAIRTPDRAEENARAPPFPFHDPRKQRKRISPPTNRAPGQSPDGLREVR